MSSATNDYRYRSAVWRIPIILIRIRIWIRIDPGCEKLRYGSGSRVNFDRDPDPGKNNTDPDPAKKDLLPVKSLKSDEKRS